MEEFAGDAFDRRRIYITGFYREPHEDLDREYPYLCEGDMQVFVAKVQQHISMDGPAIHEASVVY